MSDETNALITIPVESIYSVFTSDDGIDKYIGEVERLARDALSDLSLDETTEKGRTELKRLAAKVARSKTYMDNVGKELTAEQKKIPTKIDGNRKRMRDTLDALKDEIRNPVDVWQATEDARKQSHIDNLHAITATGEAPHDATAQDIRDRIATLGTFALDEQVNEEYHSEILLVEKESRETLLAALATVETREAEQAELAALRKAAAEREEQDRLADAAATRERREAQMKIEAVENERRRIEEEAKAAAEQKARDAAALEFAEQQRTADKEHQRKTNRAAAAGIVTAANLEMEDAVKVVEAIIRGDVPNVSIQY